MELKNTISADVIKIPLSAKTKPDIIHELVEILTKSGKIKNTELVYNHVMARENKRSTGLEKGVAVPHAKTPEVSSIVIAVGIAPNGIDFEAIDHQPSRLFFLLLAPPDQSGPHLEALAEIARICKSDETVNAIIHAATPQEVLAHLPFN